MRGWTVAGTVVTVLTAPPLHPPQSLVEARPNTPPRSPSDLHGVVGYCVSSLDSLALWSSNVLYCVVDDVVVAGPCLTLLSSNVLYCVDDVVVAGSCLMSSYRDVSTGPECFLRSTAQSSPTSGATQAPVVTAGPGPLGSRTF